MTQEPSGSRRWWILGATAITATALAIALALFQPWKLWVDDRADEAAPAGAVPVAAAPAATAPPTATTPITAPSSTAPSSTAPASTAPPASTPPASTAPPTTVPVTTVPVTTVPPTTTTAPVPIGGAFIAIDHGTAGTVVVLEDAAGARFVRLENLDTSNGPDLFVYLSTNPPDGPEAAFDDDYVDLGRLAGNLGNSNYVVPPGTDLTRYASVVIWCDRFDSAFGAAPLT